MGSIEIPVMIPDFVVEYTLFVGIVKRMGWIDKNLFACGGVKVYIGMENSTFP